MCTRSLAEHFTSIRPAVPSVLHLDDRTDGTGCYLERPNGTRLKLYMDTDGMPSFRLNPFKHRTLDQSVKMDDEGSGDSDTTVNSSESTQKRRKHHSKKGERKSKARKD